MLINIKRMHYVKLLGVMLFTFLSFELLNMLNLQDYQVYMVICFSILLVELYVLWFFAICEVSKYVFVLVGAQLSFILAAYIEIYLFHSANLNGYIGKVSYIINSLEFYAILFGSYDLFISMLNKFKTQLGETFGHFEFVWKYIREHVRR
jgi:hypothetical protein